MNMKKRVLEILCEPISNGGQEAFVMNVFNNIDRTKVQIDLYTPYYCDNANYKNIVKRNGGRVYVRGLKFNPGGLKFDIVSSIRTVLRKNRYDVVHIHSSSVFSLAMASFAAGLEKVDKVIVHSHATADKHTVKRDLIKALCTPIINKYSTDYLACSISAGEWKFSNKICNDKLKVIKNGIDVNKFSFDRKMRVEKRRELGLNDDTVLLGHVGRFSEEKNQAFIVELLKRLNEEKKQFHYKTLFIGSGDGENSIKKMVQAYGLSEDVCFLGNVDNVNDYLQAMDVFLLPSKFEGLGIVAIEAEASGLPVITSDNVPKDVVITDTVSRLSLDNISVWLDTIKEITNQFSIDDREERRECTLRIIREAGFDSKQTASEMLELYLDSTKSRILVFGMTSSPGGVESFIMNYYRHFDKTRFCFDFLCNTKDCIAYEDELVSNGSKVFHITPKAKNYIIHKKELKSFFKSHGSDYDVIWVNICNLVNISYLKLAKKYGIKRRIVHSHSTDNYEHGWRNAIHWINKKRIATVATDYWACSPDAAHWFYDKYLINKSKVIKNAIDIDNYSFDNAKRERLRNEYGINDSFVIGSVGRLTHIKNQKFLLDLCTMLSDLDFKLVFVGIGEDEEYLKSEMKKQRIENKVVFVGRQDDIQGWLSSFDVFVFPSLYEGLSLAGLEAQANGIPIIASWEAIPDEGVINKNVYRISLDKRDEWISKIYEISNKPERERFELIREKLTKSGFDIFEETKRLEKLF